MRKATVRTDGAFEPIDILVLALRGQMTLWLALDGSTIAAVAVLEVRDLPRKRICDIAFVASARGTLAGWRDAMLGAIEEHARRFGCHRVIARGRRGWTKNALGTGYRDDNTALFFKDL